jgi:hypothetical protein
MKWTRKWACALGGYNREKIGGSLSGFLAGHRPVQQDVNLKI